MVRSITAIKDISISTKGWTAKVMVFDKKSPRTARFSSKRYQKLILIDTMVCEIYL